MVTLLTQTVLAPKPLKDGITLLYTDAPNTKSDKQDKV